MAIPGKRLGVSLNEDNNLELYHEDSLHGNDLTLVLINGVWHKQEWVYEAVDEQGNEGVFEYTPVDINAELLALAQRKDSIE